MMLFINANKNSEQLQEPMWIFTPSSLLLELSVTYFLENTEV